MPKAIPQKFTLIVGNAPHPQQLVAYYFYCTTHEHNPSDHCLECAISFATNEHHKAALEQNAKYLRTRDLLLRAIKDLQGLLDGADYDDLPQWYFDELDKIKDLELFGNAKLDK